LYYIRAMSKSRARTHRRVLERDLKKLRSDQERLFLLSPGGAPDRPIRVPASPVVDIRATSMRCPLCEGTLRLDEHAAETVAGKSLRVARMTCMLCHTPREIWFDLAPDQPN
jgi:hypothetical protein